MEWSFFRASIHAWLYVPRDTIDKNQPMNTYPPTNNLHTLHSVDVDLARLNGDLLELTASLVRQLDHALRALMRGDGEAAHKILARQKKITHFGAKIDAEVLSALARHAPVANDLRHLICTSKIAVELVRMGDEIAEFARLIEVLFDPNTSDPNQKLLADIIKIGGLVKMILDKLMVVFETRDPKAAYAVLECDHACEMELQEGIKHQLSLVLHDARVIRRSLDVIEMMKALECCGEHCRSIAELAIYMLDGIDVRSNKGVV